jgi:ribonucleotide reductase beta subunit family protein with ferritin-like domain
LEAQASFCNFIKDLKIKKVMFKKFFKYTPTQQEQQFIDIVNELLEHPKTSLRMTPLSNKYFLINEQKHYYVLLKDNGVQLTNSKFSFAKSIHPKAYDIIIENIHTHIEADRQALEDKLFMNETKILSTVLTNLK